MTFISVHASIQSRGTISLPVELRKRYGLDQPGVQVEIIDADGEIICVPTFQQICLSRGFGAKIGKPARKKLTGKTLEEKVGFLTPEINFEKAWPTAAEVSVASALCVQSQEADRQGKTSPQVGGKCLSQYPT